MADVTKSSKSIESAARQWLQRRYPKKEFFKLSLELRTGGKHQFDAVAEDFSVVADVKSGKSTKPGAIKSAIADLYWLSLVKAKSRFLILTDKRFYSHFTRIMRGKIAEGVKVELGLLSRTLEKKAGEMHRRSKNENGKNK